MSPEQCRGARNADHRSDLYAVGCIGYEMLCGRPPFRAESLWDLLGQHQFAEPQRPSALAPHVPPELEAVIVTLLAKDPAHRYQSADELVVALTQVMGQKPGSAFALTRHALPPMPVSLARSERLPRSEPAVRPGPIALGPAVATDRARVEVPAVTPLAPAQTTLSLSAGVRHSGSQGAIVPEDARSSARVAPRAWRSIVAAVLLSCAVAGLLSIVLVRSQSATVVTREGDAPSGAVADHPGRPDAPPVTDGDRETRAGEAVDAGIDAALGPRSEERRPAGVARTRASEPARSSPSPASTQPPPEGRGPRPIAQAPKTTAASSEENVASSCTNGRTFARREDEARWHAQCGRHGQAAKIYEDIALAVESRSAKIQLLELAKEQYSKDGNYDKVNMIVKRIQDLN